MLQLLVLLDFCAVNQRKNSIKSQQKATFKSFTSTIKLLKKGDSKVFCHPIEKIGNPLKVELYRRLLTQSMKMR
jgi:hypothetical protein